MTYPTIVLKHAADQLRKRQEENKQITRDKKEKVYREIPELSKIGIRIAGMMKQMLASETDVSKAKKELKALISKRGELFKAHGYPKNYLEDYYECPHCRDEGFIDGVPCVCYQKLLRQEAYALSNIGDRIKQENFDTFSLAIHSEKKYMERILNKAKKYCENHVSVKKNILMTGPTGTGQTFLSSCIAKEFLDSGRFVLYFSATQILSLLDDAKFHRDSTDAQDCVDMLTDCELLIVDDLGTEYGFGYSQSRLFDILETRMISQKHTVISTNLDLDELNQKYSPRFVSRILGDYEIFIFKGKDLRYPS